MVMAGQAVMGIQGVLIIRPIPAAAAVVETMPMAATPEVAAVRAGTERNAPLTLPITAAAAAAAAGLHRLSARVAAMQAAAVSMLAEQGHTMGITAL